MLKASRERLLEQLEPDDVVLDIGGWGDPFERANWIIDLFPYETRGLYARRGWVEERSETERFSKRDLGPARHLRPRAVPVRRR